MKCNDAEKLVLLRDSGEISRDKADALKAHVQECSSCRLFEETLASASMIIDLREEPSVRSVQNVLRAARQQAPTRKRIAAFGWKPAMAMAASLAVIAGVLLAGRGGQNIGMEMIVSEAQLLELEDQVVSVMYNGLSEDDLAFNFLMTYEGDA